METKKYRSRIKAWAIFFWCIDTSIADTLTKHVYIATFRALRPNPSTLQLLIFHKGASYHNPLKSRYLPTDSLALTAGWTSLALSTSSYLWLMLLFSYKNLFYTIYGDLIDHHPQTIIILAFTLQCTNLLQSSKVTFDGTLAHWQYLRHLLAGDCRRLFNEIEDFLLALSEFLLRHVSVTFSDIRGVGRGKYNGLELGWGWWLKPKKGLWAIRWRDCNATGWRTAFRE